MVVKGNILPSSMLFAKNPNSYAMIGLIVDMHSKCTKINNHAKNSMDLVQRLYCT